MDNKKILVIEDDPSALRFIEYTLEQEGYQVLTATNGLAGLRKAQNEAPSLIVLDVMLPGQKYSPFLVQRDGYEQLQWWST